MKLYPKYFKDIQAQYEFSLIYTDGKNRLSLLGVCGLHYRNKEIAEKWYGRIRKKITDTQAVENLDSIYKEMIR